MWDKCMRTPPSFYAIRDGGVWNHVMKYFVDAREQKHLWDCLKSIGWITAKFVIYCALGALPPDDLQRRLL
jgi:hypothetical protein